MNRLVTAEDAAWAGAFAIRRNWSTARALDVEFKKSSADVATRLDRLADEAVKTSLRSGDPHSRILSEEDSRAPLASELSSDAWLVDPLDGSHNASLGLPVVGVAVSWAHGGRVRTAVVVDVFGARSLGANDAEVRIRGALSVREPSAGGIVALHQNYSTPRGSRRLAQVRDRLESTFPRVLYSWCPVIDFLLTASGHMVGWVAVAVGGPEYDAIRYLSRRIGLEERQLDTGTPGGVGARHTFVTGWPSRLDELERAVTRCA
ncbi:MAG: monophosphatase [Actinomycetota bacterium]|jgi:myo-inositol-1(or 4)-monophosphatase